ncbi:MAG: MFS transporter [Bacteroidetes Order II. Incertae sedis bacterium]|nr:MFS transporter [Bacteroidetes Order II. bacterium]
MNQTQKSDYFVLFALWLMVFSSSSQMMIIAPILPDIGRELEIDPALQGTLITSFVLSLAVLALFIGPVSDKVGRRRVILMGCGALSLTLLLHALAFDYFSFLTVRILAGMSGGLLSGSAVSYVGDYFPYERRGWANGVVMSGIAIGQVLGIPLGVTLAGLWGYKAPFVFFALPMSLAFLFTYFKVPQPQVARSDNPLDLQHIVGGYRQLLQQKPIQIAVVTYFLQFFSLMLFIVFLPTWLEKVLGLNKYHIASMYFAGGIANVTMGPQMGKWSDKIGRKPLIIASSLGMALLMALTTLVLTNLWLGYILYFLAMTFVAMRMTPLQALLTAMVSGDRRGTLLSLTVGVGQLGSGLGSALAGALYGTFGFLGNSLLAASATLLMGLVVWKFLPEPQQPASLPVAESGVIPEQSN